MADSLRHDWTHRNLKAYAEFSTAPGMHSSAAALNLRGPP